MALPETTTVTHVSAGSEGGLIRVCMKMAVEGGWRAKGRVVRYDTPQGRRLSQKLVRDTKEPET